MITSAETLPSSRQHPGSGDCLEDEREDRQNRFYGVLSTTVMHVVMHARMSGCYGDFWFAFRFLAVFHSHLSTRFGVSFCDLCYFVVVLNLDVSAR